MIRLWKHLHKEKAQESVAEKELRKRYNNFLSILSENEHSLDLMTRLEEKLYNNQLISLPYLRVAMSNLSKHVAYMAETLIQLSGGEYTGLREQYRNIDNQIREILTGSRERRYTPLIIPLTEIRKELADKVGNKMANLGEMHNCCGQLVPAGFAATACAYTHFIDYNNLTSQIHVVLDSLDANDQRQLLEAEQTIRNLFLQAVIPPEIEQAILRESARLEKEKGRPLFWAVRSSAIGEDMAESSFAGQFSTLLNVPAHQLLQAYKEVAASKYNARVMIYQRMRNIRDDDVAMSVGFLEMIDPVSSGVLYSLNPVQPEGGEMVINAVWGVGELLVDGVISADTYLVKKTPGFPLAHVETADKEICLTRIENGGLAQQAVSGEKSRSRCLDDGQIRQLAEKAMRIEAHFQAPQDIEWCFDQQHDGYILQARPLRVFEKTGQASGGIPAQVKIISSQGQPISPGVGHGKVVKAACIGDLPQEIPQWTILILKHSSPRFIGALREVAAVVVEKGNWTDHMASVIREFGIPCLVRVTGIFEQVANGQEITIDANNGMVYEGVVPGLQVEKAALKENSANIALTESHRLLQGAAEYIFPLHLTDPRGENFTSSSCQTLHDILRFCHETAMNEMFALKDKCRLHSVKNIFKVRTTLPISLYVMDITGSTIEKGAEAIIEAKTIKSLPFQKLWEGMCDPAVNWNGPERSVQGKDLLSAMLRTQVFDTAPADTRSYAVVSPEYLNLSLSMGYHYVVLDCYLSEDSYNNYISLSFKGGAAEACKRNLRACFVSQVLRHLDFNVMASGDFLKARLKAESADEFGKRLYSIGHILGVTRLLDLAMEDEAMVEKCVARFLVQDYTLGLYQGK